VYKLEGTSAPMPHAIVIFDSTKFTNKTTKTETVSYNEEPNTRNIQHSCYSYMHCKQNFESCTVGYLEQPIMLMYLTGRHYLSNSNTFIPTLRILLYHVIYTVSHKILFL